jgi:3'-phosphoadenosine 5'-phosphosulfate (PAPS) 3'-phosphatase
VDLNAELSFAKKLAITAGNFAKSQQKNLQVTKKPNGGGFVTQVDIAIDKEIVNEIAKTFPNDQIISEESFIENSPFKIGKRTWLIDPIDGTSDYVAGGKDYVVMIGLLIDHSPTLGVIYQPNLDLLWTGINLNSSTQASVKKNLINKNATLKTKENLEYKNLTLAISKTHSSKKNTEFADLGSVKNILRHSSVGFKAMLVAQNDADIYFAWSRKIKLWDTCAPAAIVGGAGGIFCHIDGTPLKYFDQISHQAPIVVANQPAFNIAKQIIPMINGL